MDFFLDAYSSLLNIPHLESLLGCVTSHGVMTSLQTHQRTPVVQIPWGCKGCLAFSTTGIAMPPVKHNIQLGSNEKNTWLFIVYLLLNTGCMVGTNSDPIEVFFLQNRKKHYSNNTVNFWTWQKNMQINMHKPDGSFFPCVVFPHPCHFWWKNELCHESSSHFCTPFVQNPMDHWNPASSIVFSTLGATGTAAKPRKFRQNWNNNTWSTWYAIIL